METTSDSDEFEQSMTEFDVDKIDEDKVLDVENQTSIEHRHKAFLSSLNLEDIDLEAGQIRTSGSFEAGDKGPKKGLPGIRRAGTVPKDFKHQTDDELQGKDLNASNGSFQESFGKLVKSTFSRSFRRNTSGKDKANLETVQRTASPGRKAIEKTAEAKEERRQNRRKPRQFNNEATGVVNQPRARRGVPLRAQSLDDTLRSFRLRRTESNENRLRLRRTATGEGQGHTSTPQESEAGIWPTVRGGAARGLLRERSAVDVWRDRSTRLLVQQEDSSQTASVTSDDSQVEEEPIKEPEFVNPDFELKTHSRLIDAQAAQKRLDMLRGASDTRDYVGVWNEKRYCHRMFRHRAEVDYPNLTCVEIWDAPEKMTISKTYAQMHQGAQSIARWVSAACAKTSTKDKVICIYLPRSYELLATVIGTWYAGAVVNVTDTKLPWERLGFIAADADAAVIITTEELVGDSPENMPCPILNVKAAIAHDGATQGDAPIWLNHLGLADGVVLPELGAVLDTNIEDDDCCVAIYTSGSTGNPKGVRLQYKAFSNYACIEQVLTLPSPSDRIVQTQSLSFIAGFHECWRGLTSGATLLLANSKITGLGPDLEDWLRNNDVTIMKAVPSLLRSMVIGDRPPTLPKLRLFHVGGEAVTQELVNIFGQGRLFLNTYGSTESCSNCVIGFCTPGDSVCTIGTALPSFQAYVLEKADSRKESTIGELFIGGMSLAKDYLNLEEKTKEVFIEHPKYGRLYNTGDCVERLESGNLVYRGRKDNQTKINGYRVELGEVEAKMNMIDIVKESAAVVVDNALYTFISLADGHSMTLEEFKKKLKDLSLPFFAMPSRLKVIKEFPKTISGKLDRKVLVQQIQEEKEKAMNAGAALDQSTVLGVIMSAFAGVLRTEVKPTDDFFLLGGDSASAGQTVGLIRHKGEALGLKKISIMDLYTHRTPAALEAHLGSNAEKGFVEDIFRWKRLPMQDSPNKTLFDVVTFLVGLTLNCLNNMEVFLYFIIVWTSGFAIPVTHETTIAVPHIKETFVVAWELFCVKIFFYAFWTVFTVIVKWSIIGRYKEGRWAKYGSMHLRHWIIVQVSSNLPWRLIGGTGLNKWIMRALGARIGKGTFTFFEPATGLPMNGYDLFELEDFSSICQGAYCSPIYFTEDSMVCGRISLGRSSSLYPRSTACGSVRLEEGAVLEPLSNATDGTVLGAWERWTGSPARPARRPGYDVDSIKPPHMHTFSEFATTVAQTFDIFAGYYIILCISMIPRYFLLVYLGDGAEAQVSPGLFVASVVSSVFFGSLALSWFSVLMVQLANFFFPSQSGAYHIHSWTALVLWHKGFWFKSPQLMINNTRFLQWYARLCGMKLGDHSHISIVRGSIPDLVTIGKNTFLANPCFLGVPVVHNSYFHVGTVEIGDDVLVGNNACFMINTSVPSNTTVAVNTGAPPDDAKPGGVWVGYPPVRITDNNEIPFPDGPLLKRMLMMLSEVLIIFIPGTLWACTILSWLYIFVYAVLRQDWLPDHLLLQMLVGAVFLVPMRAFWAIFGGLLARLIFTGFSNKPEERNVGYWSALPFSWRIYNKIWAFFLIPMLLKDFSGSIWMNRLVNFLTMAEIEEDVLIVHHGLFKDHNWIRVRKGATINEACVLRTHTFEDWRLKFGFVEIGPRTVVHPSSTIMFGTVTKEDCTIVSNTLVLKGDQLENGTIVAGIPSVEVENREIDETKDDIELGVEQSSEFELTIWV